MSENVTNKLTVDDFVNISKKYNIVRIETEPGKFDSLDSTPIDLTDVMDMMSISLLNTLADSSSFYKQFGSLMQPNTGLNKQDIKTKLFDLLIEQGVVSLIKFDEYDKETLDAYRLYQLIKAGGD